MDKYTNFLKLYNKYDINDYVIIKSIKNKNIDYLEINNFHRKHQLTIF